MSLISVINTEEVRAWDGKSDSAMQFLSFCFSLGGVFGPLITEPFLTPKRHNTNGTAESNVNYVTDIPTEVTPLSKDVTVNTSQHSYAKIGELANCSDTEYFSLQNSSFSCNPNINGTSHVFHLESKLQFAYLITAVLTLLTSVPFYYMCIKFRSKVEERKKKEIPASSGARKLPKNVFMILLTLACFYYFIHSMAEDSFSQYLFFFVTTELDWPKTNGAWINSLYWGFSTCIKLALVLLMKKIDTGNLLFLSTVGMVVSSALFSVAGKLQLDLLIWISTCVFALSQSAVYAGELSWVDANLIRLGGMETSTLMVFSGFGAMIGPVIQGPLMKTYSLMVFPYMVLTECVISSILFSIKLFIAKPIVIRKYGPPRLPTTTDVDDRVEHTETLLEARTIDGNREPIQL